MSNQDLFNNINLNKLSASSDVKAIIIALMNLVEELKKENETLRKENEELKAKIRELSGQNPKPDIKANVSPKTESTVSEDKNHTKKRGVSRERVISIDKEKIYESPEEYCPNCKGQKMHFHSKDVVITQDIIFKRENIKHTFTTAICPCCGHTSRAKLPDEYGGTHFGSGLRAYISIQHYECRVPEKKIHKFLTAVGIVISETEIDKLLLDNGSLIEPSVRIIHERGISVSSYTQMDETGWRTKGRNNYLYYHGSDRFSYFEIADKRNHQTAERILTEQGRSKPLLTDDHSSYHPVRARKKALCWVHEIRHYKKIYPYFKENKDIIDRKISELWELYDQLKEYKVNPNSILKEQISSRFDEIVKEKTDYEVLNKQLKLTARKKKRLLLSLKHPQIPLHNNDAEQSIRHSVIYRKISGGCRSPSGEKSLSSHLSLFDTCRKLGLSVWDTMFGFIKGTITSNSFALCVTTNPN